MSFNMGPVPIVFLRVAWASLEKQLVMPLDVKAKLAVEIERQHLRPQSHRELVRALGVVLYGVDWSWPRAEAKNSDQDLYDLLARWLVSTPNKLYRRTQIRAVVINDADRRIRFSLSNSDGASAPCGKCEGEVFDATPEILVSLPPCKDPLCDCSCFVLPSR